MGSVNIYIGVDPGLSGGLAALRYNVGEMRVEKVETHAFKKITPSELWGVFDMLAWCDCSEVEAWIENVHAMPKQGVASTFKFGTSFGMLLGFLTASGIPFERVTPSTWQRKMKCLSKGDKKVTKARAQELFPIVEVTHAVADALLIAECLKRTKLGIG
jgi:crossover junction endodeoxyribonuclease RuvC